MGQCCSQDVDTKNGAKVNSNKQAKANPSVQPTSSSSYEPTPETSASFQSTPPQRSTRKPSPPTLINTFIQPENAGKAREEENYEDLILDKTFGYPRNFDSKYKLGPEVGRGHFGYTCSGSVKHGDLQGQTVAIKLISKAKMTTAIEIEDVQREVKILRALSGHENIVQFYDACEDADNIYIIMELCKGGELLDHLLARGGKYAEEDAKGIAIQMLNAVAFIHLQGVAHRDLKPENFLFTSQDEGSELKAIDFGLADFVKPDEKLSDIVGSAYYVAPEVLQQSYGIEADVWSLGVIIYMLLSGSRPFWARTESGIFHAVAQEDPSYDEMPWPSISPEAKDFVKKLLNKDYQKRLTAAQALTHPWLRGNHKIPLDILTLKLVKSYLQCSSLRRSALKALAKTLAGDDFFYLGTQFMLLKPGKDGGISKENFKEALLKYATEAMKDSQAWKILKSMHALSFQRMYFEEFCAAALNVHQLEETERWEEITAQAFEIFNKKGNRLVSVEELTQEMELPATIPASTFLHDWVRLEDGKLSFTGFMKLLLA